ncbi:interleukin-17-4 [Plakobranchus ocellatus]|uniref:Interleukin-17-4 n=1 Tax=Plakobranchus ocellatus TaxID=259542 RepID=A0AAV3Y9J1_9GAST|nr:interleukin-17-4 [Plakobranchus ocellatus]
MGNPVTVSGSSSSSSSNSNSSSNNNNNNKATPIKEQTNNNNNYNINDNSSKKHNNHKSTNKKIDKMFTRIWNFVIISLLMAEELTGQAYGQSLDGHNEACTEPADLLALYTNLRQQQIQDSSVLPEPTQETSSSSSSSSPSSSSTITRLAGSHHSPYSARIPRHGRGVCRCHAWDELNHDSSRIPRILVQSRCGPYIPWRTYNYSSECENISTNVRVKRRAGCVNGVYQYVDAWEAVPVGCRCQIYPRVYATRG